MNKQIKSFVFPGNIHKEVLEIGAQQVPYMRTEEFSSLVQENERILLDLLNCSDGAVIPFTASGTAAMESVVTNLVRGHDKVLVINGGTFGARWGSICRYYNVSYQEVLVPFGCEPNYLDLKNLILSEEFDFILMQHNETSSGFLYDIERIGKWCKASGTIFIVDAISSFLSDYLSLSSFNVDVAILSSQKGLDLPPGLSFVVLSERIATIEFQSGSFYFDWKENLSNLKRGQTPYSPATHIFLQLNRRLQMILAEGIDNVINSVARKANTFRTGFSESREFSAKIMSNCVTGVYLKKDAKPFIEMMRNEGVFVMPSGISNLIRVAHLGILTEVDHIDLIKRIEKWEKK